MKLRFQADISFFSHDAKIKPFSKVILMIIDSLGSRNKLLPLFIDTA
jgi:hypothetical protein